MGAGRQEPTQEKIKLWILSGSARAIIGPTGSHEASMT